MKLKPINIQGYEVLVDESAEIKEGDKVVYAEKEILTLLDTDEFCGFEEDGGVGTVRLKYCVKIIFAEKKLNLDVPILPNWREWEVEQLVIKHLTKEFENSDNKEFFDSSRARSSFISGYNHNKAKYTEEDFAKLISHLSIELMIHPPKSFDEILIKAFNIKQSLQKVPKYIVMESEDSFVDNSEVFVHSSGAKGQYSTHNKKPKLITNSDGKQEGIIKEIIW